MKSFFRNIEESLADAALLEMGVDVEATKTARVDLTHESLEENLIEVAFAEAADYQDIHEAILREHQQEWLIAHPDDCGQGDNDLCFV